MGEPPLSHFEVIRFLLNKGGRCTNFELVSNFRGILNDPRHQAEARLRFKDIINSVAIVGEYQNVKYIELKKEYYPANSGKPQNADQPQSDHSNLSSDSSNTSSYNSPLTQSFQPYWRYRLSTSPQLPPPKRTDVDAVLRSSSSKAFNRSVSESALQPDRVPPPRARNAKTISEEHYSQEQQPRTSNTANYPTSSWSREPNEGFKSSSHNSYDGSSYESLPPYDTKLQYSNSVSSSDSSSLPYYNSHQFTPESRIQYNESRGGNLDKSITRGASESSFNLTSSNMGPIKRPDSYANMINKSRLTVGNPVYNTRPRSRTSFDDSYLPQSDPFQSVKNSPSFRSPSNTELHKANEQSPLGRKSHNLARSESSLSNRSSDSQRYSEMNWEDGDGNDVFADPNYMRTVSKLCLERNKASKSSCNIFKNTEPSPRSEKPNDISKTVSQDELPVKFMENKIGEIHNYSMNETILAEDVNHIPPVPPERRRKSLDISQKPNKEIKNIAENVDIENATKEESLPGKVKDRVQHFDEMEKKQRKVVSSSNKENRVSIKSTGGLEDDVSISVLDPKLKREWFVKSSQCDYHALVALLKKEPKLAALKDIASGYTALHWAAKHGDANVVKLIAGSYKVNPNIRSNGGYTPVHVASLYKHDIIKSLLIHTYGADPSLRDYHGKRADQYPNNYVQMVAGQKKVERRPLKQRPLVSKEPSGNSFMRIGSLNLRKARKSTVFASVRGSNRNWGSSSELRLGGQATTRKKVNKRESLLLDRKSVVEKKDDSDSDSAYGFPSKKQQES